MLFIIKQINENFSRDLAAEQRKIVNIEHIKKEIRATLKKSNEQKK
jgi:hypothetical protein